MVVRLKVGNFISRLKGISTKFNGSEPAKAEEVASTADVPSPPDEAAVPTPRRRSGLLGRGRKQPTGRPLVRPFYRRPVFWLLIAGMGSGAAFINWGYWQIDATLPDPGDISTFVRDGTLTIKASDGALLQQLGPATRDKLTYKQIPKDVIEAFLAAEDRRFYQHGGVDVQAVVRALASNLVARDVVEGGSTITQQVTRIVFLNQERSLWRKVQEALLAIKIEREMPKDQILERYLNLVYLGSGAYGVADAAWVYFSKSINDLTLAEIATIAGLPPAPSVYSPLVNPEIARQRRNVVLQRMQDAGFISEATAEATSREPLNLKPSVPKRLYSETPYFTAYVRQQLPRYVSKEDLELGGLTVETTLNYRWQKVAEQVIERAIKNDGPNEGFSQAALVAIDPRNGEIRAMVGGTDFNKSQFNRATQAQRQPGSSFKTIVYTAAIAAGFSPYQTYVDAPYTIDNYQPQNYGNKYFGTMTLRDALTSSLNVVAVKLLLDVGFEPVINLGKQMGVKSKLQPTYSLALGAWEVNLMEMTSVYATLAAEGVHVETHGIRRILNRKGEVLYDADFKSKRVLDKGTAAIMTWMLENVVRNGTGRPAQLGRPVAGKTGTSEQARDLWFIGYIPQLAIGVWLGNDDSSPTWGTSGTAAYTWHQFMARIVPGMPVQPFPKLPKLEGRKGMIKAKPVKPTRAYDGVLPERDRQSQPPPAAPAPVNAGGSAAPVQQEPAPPPSPEPPVDAGPPPEVPPPPPPPEPPADPAPVDPAPADPAPAPT